MSPTGISRQNLQIQLVMRQFLHHLYIARGEGGLVGGDVVFGDSLEQTEADGEAYFIEYFIHGGAQSLASVVDVHHPAAEALSVEEASVEAVASYLAVRLVSQYVGEERPVLLQSFDALCIKSVRMEERESLLWLSAEETYHLLCWNIPHWDNLVSLRIFLKREASKFLSIPYIKQA